MAKTGKSCLYLLTLVTTAASLACGGGGASVTGSDAAAGSPPSASAPSAAARSATIQGTLRSGAAAASDLSAASVGGIRVSVVGTGIQVTTDGSGNFTLTGVPAGSAELRFEGKGLDARLTITGLVAGQTLTLTVQVAGNSVTRVGDDDQHSQGDGNDDNGDDDHNQGQVEFEGTVSALSPLTIGARHVTTSSSTRYLGHHHETLQAADVLKLGNKVEVEGQIQSDKSVLAATIQLED